MQIFPPDFVMFQNFKHQIPCVTMQLTTPTTLTTYLLLQRPPSYHFRRKILYFSDKGTDKYATQYSPKHAISSEKSVFSEEGSSRLPRPLPVGRGTPLPTPNPSPHTNPSAAAPASSQNSSQIYATAYEGLV